VRVVKLIFIILITLTPQLSFGQDKTAPKPVSPVDFFKVEITLSVNDSFASVKGIYYFRNNSNHEGRFPIIFPFYVDSVSLFPDTILAYIVNKNDTTNLRFGNERMQNAIMIEIPLSPSDTTIWHLDYRQRILESRATYILTSTGAWGKPLEEGTYKFEVPPSFKGVRVWPEADSTITESNGTEYLAHRTIFMPKQDMTIEWKAKK
jgi:hypothetical protein